MSVTVMQPDWSAHLAILLLFIHYSASA